MKLLIIVEHTAEPGGPAGPVGPLGPGGQLQAFSPCFSGGLYKRPFSPLGPGWPAAPASPSIPSSPGAPTGPGGQDNRRAIRISFQASSAKTLNSSIFNWSLFCMVAIFCHKMGKKRSTLIIAPMLITMASEPAVVIQNDKKDNFRSIYERNVDTKNLAVNDYIYGDNRYVPIFWHNKLDSS
uniref:Uncharacterized protein n=1 Tax=Romanomermis culicivorax TaxID=13658 RepID=A0A915J992_ROMCU